MLCHPQQIASTKTNLLLYDKRTCLGRNKLNLGVVIWVWCLHIWPMLHRPAEVRVSNYYAGVLRIVQRDAKANGVFVQLTSPWREQVLLGTLWAIHEWGSSEEFGRFIGEQSCAFSVFSILRWFDALCSGGSREASPRAPKSGISQLFWRLCCFVERDRAERAFQERAREICPAGCALPCVSLHGPFEHVQGAARCQGSSQRCRAGNQVLPVCSRPCSWMQLWGGFPRPSVEMLSLEGAEVY